MYAIYGSIYHQYIPNVSIYIPYMDPMGLILTIYMEDDQLLTMYGSFLSGRLLMVNEIHRRMMLLNV